MIGLVALVVSALPLAAGPQEDHVAAARRLAEGGRLGEAIELLQDDSTDPRRLAALAELLTRADRLPEAEDALRRALLAAPQATPLAVTRASLLFRLSRYAEAREVLGPIVEHEPNHAFAHYYLGAIALRTADPETAVRHAQRAITGFPENAGTAGGSDGRAEALSLLGEAQLAVGEATTGEASLREAISLAPFHAGPRYLLGRHLITSERVTEGERELATFAAAKAASEAVTLGISLFRDAGKPEAAEAELRRALELWPDHPPALMALVGLLRAAGRHEEVRALEARLAAVRQR